MRTIRGFNLLEVIIGALLFSGASIALTTIWLSHYRALGKARHRVVANLLAQSVLERAVSDGFFALPDFSTTLTQQTIVTNLNGQSIDVVYDIKTDIERFGNISPPPPARADKLKKVTVVVSWGEPGGKRNVELETVVASAE